MDTKDNDEEISCNSAHDRVRSFRSSLVVPPTSRFHDSPHTGWYDEKDDMKEQEGSDRRVV